MSAVRIDAVAGVASLVIALAVASISLIVSRAEIFRPLRDRLSTAESPVARWIGSLVRCMFCTSVWVTAAFVVACRPRVIVTESAAADYVATAFAIVAAAGFLDWLLYAAQVAVATDAACGAKVRKLQDALRKAKVLLTDRHSPPRE